MSKDKTYSVSIEKDMGRIFPTEFTAQEILDHIEDRMRYTSVTEMSDLGTALKAVGLEMSLGTFFTLMGDLIEGPDDKDLDEGGLVISPEMESVMRKIAIEVFKEGQGNSVRW
jgi:hypothetical protein